MLAYVFHEVSHLYHVPKEHAFHRLYQFTSYAVSAQNGNKRNRFFVCLCEYARRTFALMRHQAIHKRLIHIQRIAVDDLYSTVAFFHRLYRRHLHSPAYVTQKVVREINQMTLTAVILRHFYKTAPLFLCQLIHIFRVRPAKLVNVLVVITNGYHAHVSYLRNLTDRKRSRHYDNYRIPSSCQCKWGMLM